MLVRRSPLVLLLFVAACATTGQGGLPAKYDRLALQLESTAPDAAQLEAGKLTEAWRVLKIMDAAIDAAGIDALDPSLRSAFVARVKAARRRYRIAVAQKLTDPTLASSVLVGELEAPDVWAALVDVVGRLETLRQSEYAQHGSYKRTRAVVHESSSTSIVNGQVVASRQSVRVGGEQANCAFATAPFPPEGQPNPALRYHFAGARPQVYVRCYAPGRDLSRLPPGRLLASIPAGNRNLVIDLGTPAQLAPGTAAIDFVIGARQAEALPSERGLVDVELVHISAPDNIVVVQNGALRVRPDWRRRVLGSGSFLWERGGVDGGREKND